MFEQSILIHQAHAKKTGAVAVSLTAQMVLVGTLLLIPLVYPERLPFVQPTLPMFLQLTPPPPPREPTQTAHVRPRPGGRNFIPTSIPPLRQFDDIAPISEPNTDVVSATVAPPALIGTLMAVIPPPPLPPVVTVPVETAPAKPVILTSAILASKLIRKVVPMYPRIAVTTRVSGTVKLRGVIAKDGTVQQLEVLSGHPLLTQAAVDAVRQWLYTPTLLHGSPVEVSAPIDVIFTLAQ
jgi:protein TonB